jgi:hypothetical protein
VQHETFHYRSPEDVRRTAESLNCFLPLSAATRTLFAPVMLAGKTVDNRIAFQPMEGSDGTAEGDIGEMTRRRYLRFAKAGPGIIWFEAVATSKRVRSTPRQLFLTPDNVGNFRRLNDEIRETCLRENGYVPLLIMQANNSGAIPSPRASPNR